MRRPACKDAPMADLVRYRSIVADSDRWCRFEHRPGDIVITTPPKSGTTWTQMLCALMVFDTTDLPAKLDALSPWLDMLIRTDEEVFAVLDAQTHRRFIKTHTPLDGLPLRDDVTYVVVGRDPRDVLVSWEHHIANMEVEVLFTDLAAGGAFDDQAPPDDSEPAVTDEPDPTARMLAFIDATSAPDHLVSLANVLHHLETGWDRRHQPNVGLFHYADYQRDLVGQMVRLAELCGFEQGRDRLAELAPAAGIDAMRARADDLAPDLAKSNHWKDPAAFFRSGTSGEWLERATPDLVERYAERVAELVPEPLARWAHEGGPID
jgi:aryl sulfotransferase